MMRQVRGATGLYRRRERGAAFLYFTLVAVPLLFFAAALAVDFTRIIIAGRQVANAASAAALSGAAQTLVQSGQLRAAVDPAQARSAAVDTYCTASRDGALSLSSPTGTSTACPEGGRVSVDVALRDMATKTGGYTSGGYTSVEVTAHYKVDNLIFFSFFGAGRDYTGPTVVRSAAVCVPGDSSGPTSGFCRRPTD